MRMPKFKFNIWTFIYGPILRSLAHTYQRHDKHPFCMFKLVRYSAGPLSISKPRFIYFYFVHHDASMPSLRQATHRAGDTLALSSEMDLGLWLYTEATLNARCEHLMERMLHSKTFVQAYIRTKLTSPLSCHWYSLLHCRPIYQVLMVPNEGDKIIIVVPRLEIGPAADFCVETWRPGTDLDIRVLWTLTESTNWNGLGGG